MQRDGRRLGNREWQAMDRKAVNGTVGRKKAALSGL